MLVVNAPSFFAFSWKLIKNFIDPRTASRIQLFSSKDKGQKALEKLVHKDTEMPIDYGGGNISLGEAFLKECMDPLIVRQEIELIYCKRKNKKSIPTAWTLQENETMGITVYTRSVSEADINIIWNGSIIKTIQAQCRFGSGENGGDKNDVDNGTPYPNRITVVTSKELVGPGEVSVEVKDLDSTISKRNSSMSRGYYLVVGDAKAAAAVEESPGKRNNKRVSFTDDNANANTTAGKPPKGASVTMNGLSAPTTKKAKS